MNLCNKYVGHNIYNNAINIIKLRNAIYCVDFNIYETFKYLKRALYLAYFQFRLINYRN